MHDQQGQDNRSAEADSRIRKGQSSPASLPSKILLIVSGVLVLGCLLWFGSTVIWDGGVPFRLLVVEKGKEVPHERIKQIAFLSIANLGEAASMAAELSEADTNTQRDQIACMKPVAEDAGVWHVQVPTYGCSYCFGLWKTCGWRPALLAGIELDDGLFAFRDLPVKSIEGDRTLVLNLDPHD